KIHLEAHAEQDFFGVNVGGHARVAQRADEDSIKVARQHGEAIRRDGGAVLQVAVGRPVQGGEVNCSSAGFHHFQSSGNDLFTDTVTRNYSYAFFSHTINIAIGSWQWLCTKTNPTTDEH